MNRLLLASFWVAWLTVVVLSLLPVEHSLPAAFNWWDKARMRWASWCSVVSVFGLCSKALSSRRWPVGLGCPDRTRLVRHWIAVWELAGLAGRRDWSGYGLRRIADLPQD
jgi:hypothetical protein